MIVNTCTEERLEARYGQLDPGDVFIDRHGDTWIKTDEDTAVNPNNGFVAYPRDPELVLYLPKATLVADGDGVVA